MSCDVGCRRGSDPALWLWRRLACVAPIQPLDWEPPYTSGVALKQTKKKKKKTFSVGSSCHGAAETNPTRNHVAAGFDPSLG